MSKQEGVKYSYNKCDFQETRKNSIKLNTESESKHECDIYSSSAGGGGAN